MFLHPKIQQAVAVRHAEIKSFIWRMNIYQGAGMSPPPPKTTHVQITLPGSATEHKNVTSRITLVTAGIL